MELSVILAIIAGVCILSVVAFVLDEHWKENHGSNHF